MHAAAEKILEGTGPSEKLRTTGQGRHRFICVASAQLETGRAETRSVVSGTAAGGLGGAATGIFYIEGSDVCTTACSCQYPLNRTFQIWHFRCLYITPRKRGFTNAQEAVEHSRTRLQPRPCRALRRRRRRHRLCPTEGARRGRAAPQGDFAPARGVGDAGARGPRPPRCSRVTQERRTHAARDRVWAQTRGSPRVSKGDGGCGLFNIYTRVSPR